MTQTLVVPNLAVVASGSGSGAMAAEPVVVHDAAVDDLDDRWSHA